MNLYLIQQEYLSLAQRLMDNEGELTPELNEQLAINQEQLQAKGINYGLVIKQIEAEVDIIDAEIKRLQGLKAVRNNASERLRNNILQAMQLYTIDKIESSTLKISIRKSEAVEVENLELLDENFIVSKTTKSADKKAIKEAINLGQEVKGASLVTNHNLQIK